MRHRALLLLVLLLTGSSGCTSVREQVYGKTEDEWEEVGDIGRGERPRQKESDGLTKWISSPQAIAIERNLGIE